MKRKVSIGIIIATFLLIAAPGAFAATVSWKDLTWTIRGTSNTATVTDGYLSISVLGGNSGDPSPDNWAVYAKPTGAIKWYQFTFTDPGGETRYSPRAYASANLPGGGEMLMQGGVRAPSYPQTYTNMHVWDPLTNNEDWSFENWTQVTTDRPPGDHTFKVGLGSNGEVDFLYDGTLVAKYRVGQTYGGELFNWEATNDRLNIAYLGVRAATGESGTIIYKDFQWGTEYQPVPLPGTVLLLGSSLVGLGLLRGRKFFRR